MKKVVIKVGILLTAVFIISLVNNYIVGSSTSLDKWNGTDNAKTYINKIATSLEEYAKTKTFKIDSGKYVKLELVDKRTYVNSNRGTIRGTVDAGYVYNKFIKEIRSVKDPASAVRYGSYDDHKSRFVVTPIIEPDYSELVSTFNYHVNLYNDCIERYRNNVGNPIIRPDLNSTTDLGIVDNPIVNLSTDNSSYDCSDSGWWGCAYKFLATGRANNGLGVTVGLVTELKDMVFDVGNILFIIITSFLGVKFIWGSAESKASINHSLFNLVVAAVFFYGWSAIVSLFNVEGLLTGTTAAGGYKPVALQIYSVILYIINFLAAGGIIYIGVKYMLAGADGKSDMKLRMVPAAIGIIMVYASIQFINFILGVVGII